MKVLQSDYGFYLSDSFVYHKDIALKVVSCSSDFSSITVMPVDRNLTYNINPNKLSYKYFNIGFINGVYYYNDTKKVFRFGMHENRIGTINYNDRLCYELSTLLTINKEKFPSFKYVLSKGIGSWHKDWYLEYGAIFYKGFKVGSLTNKDIIYEEYSFLKEEFYETSKANIK